MTSRAKTPKSTPLNRWVEDLTRQFIDGITLCPTFTAECRNGQWGIYTEYIYEDTRSHESRTGDWFITYSGVTDEAGVRAVVARMDALT